MNISSDDFCSLYCANISIYHNYNVCTERDYVDCWLEPKSIVEEKLLWVGTVLMLALLVTGVLGNVAVCAVILKHSSMRTNTNYYLFSLAISDLLLLIFGIPPDLLYYWQTYPYVLGQFFCKFNVLIAEMAAYSSVLTVVVFSLERYFAICHPMRAHIWKRARPMLALIGVWALAVICAIPFTLAVDVYSEITYPPGTKNSPLAETCNVPNHSKKWLNYYLQVISVTFFAVPVLILLTVYICMGKTIRMRSRCNQNFNGGHSTNNDTSSGTIRLLVAVVVSFFICWTPFHYQRIINPKISREQGRKLYVLSGFFYYLSATLNPILYNIISRKYRAAFKDIFGKHKLMKIGKDSIKETTKLNSTTETKTTNIELNNLKSDTV